MATQIASVKSECIYSVDQANLQSREAKFHLLAPKQASKSGCARRDTADQLELLSARTKNYIAMCSFTVRFSWSQETL
eukprot:1832774-Amphidinium_carterae.1